MAGFDDAPFAPTEHGDVMIVGTVFCDLRLEGVVSTRVRRDGANATRRVAQAIGCSRFASHLQAILLQGIAFAGFNVVDIHELQRALETPVVTVMRSRPDMHAIKRALLDKVPGGARKWRLIESAGTPECAGKVFIQRAGIAHAEAVELVERLAVHSDLPEPLRTAHMVAGGVQRGESRHRP